MHKSRISHNYKLKSSVNEIKKETKDTRPFENAIVLLPRKFNSRTLLLFFPRHVQIQQTENEQTKQLRKTSIKGRCEQKGSVEGTEEQYTDVTRLSSRSASPASILLALFSCFFSR